MGPAPAEPSGLPPKQRKLKTYQVLGDVNEYQERLATTLPPPKAPPPPNVFTIQDTSEFPPEIWFAATISPDNGVSVIASFRELSKARALYQQQLNNIYTARKLSNISSSLQPLAPFNSQLSAGSSGGNAIAGGGGTGSGGLPAGPGAPPFASPPSGGPSSSFYTSAYTSGEPPVHRTITETVRLGAETRRLGKFELQQQKWDEVTAVLASKIGRPPQELAMQRGPAWRTRAELTELLYRAQPRDARGLNPDELTPGGLVVQQQQQQGSVATGGSYNGINGAGSLLGKPVVGRSLSARGRSWEDSELLRQRVAEYGTRLRALAPHDPDFGSLVVAGEALEGQLEALATAPIRLAEVEVHMRAHHPEAFEAYKAVKDEMEAQFRAALEAEEAQRAAAEAAAAAAGPQPGPHITASTRHLTLSCHVGERSHGSVTLSCSGTAAVWWRWEARPDPQPTHSAAESGTLLPGQSLELSITFMGSAAGTFRETWQLVTTPPLQGPDGPVLTLHLRGLAELRDQSATGRATITATLAQREKMAKVAAAVERVLRDVRMPRRPQPTEVAEETAAADAWDLANGCSADGGPYAWPPLFYSSAIRPRVGTAERQRKKPVEEPPPPPPKYPPMWDGANIAVLDALLAELATVAPAAATPLLARADAAKARARVPPNGRRLLRRAMRSLVLKMADAVEDKLGVVRADLEAKAAAEAAAAAAAAAEDAAEGHELIGGEGSMLSVGTTATAAGGGGAHGKKEKGGKDKKAGSKGGAKGSGGGAHGGAVGEHGGGAAAAAAAAAAAVAAAAAADPLSLPGFHDKAMSGAKSVVKPQDAGSGPTATAAAAAAAAAAVGGVRADWYVPPAGGVPAPNPGAPAAVRSATLEQLYWDRLCVLRTWTALGIPNRADIR
ncbi:hypothetical protein VOLCADRAFT_92519 [Volvox carteri f. nagariensis]|uniref:Uncharacterized protein n=1 Tax=Volvox carteri f. nagariensis TaxID=3068 RepID=D8TZV8_VOLCA|nr:uncharacterized protein VOLCADRAFT_92519 [Volvox carteri f. nagariensis]EFJ46991.1 hypothetical protein VOLCADRAFT_92519 [Volvox carteri f. nagariensis]|eukprot:XP_002951886.1 hypothetical protein VOLCADRAFT_92519 [Volvox carteri f. nagariensis]